jgi:hypothetical protein
MKKILSLFVVAAAFAGCSKSSNSAPANSADVMFVNGCAGTGSVYVTDGSTKVTGASNIAFAGTSGYQYIMAGSPDITFYVSSLGGTDPLKSFNASFAANTHYSVFVGGIITNSSYVVTADDVSAPPSGNAKVRFINLSNDTLSENVAANTTSIATGITSLQASSFTDITAGTYIIKAGDPANIGSVVSTASLSFSAGKIYTVMLTGTLSGTGTSGLTLTAINNN